MSNIGSVELRRLMILGVVVVFKIVSKRENSLFFQQPKKKGGQLTFSMMPRLIAHHSTSSRTVKVEVLGVLGVFVSCSADVDTQR